MWKCMHVLAVLCCHCHLAWSATAGNVATSDTSWWTPKDIIECVPVAGRYHMCLRQEDNRSFWVLTKHVGEYGWVPLASDVRRFGLRAPYIFGEAGSQYFLLKWSHQGGAQEEMLSFPWREEWVLALDSAGIQEPRDMSAPSMVAAGRSRVELQPWRYRFLKGLAGFDDEQWAIAAMWFSFVAAFGLGFSLGNLRTAALVSMVLGACAGCVGDTLVFEGAGLGIIGSPVCAAGAAAMGWLFRRLIGYLQPR